MERLTSRDSKGNLCLCNKEVYGNNQDIYNAIAVLEDYENTGITPDQLQVINEEYQKMAKELVELRQQNRWIPVEESLPDAFKPVIVCRKNGKVEQGDTKCKRLVESVWHEYKVGCSMAAITRTI